MLFGDLYSQMVHCFCILNSSALVGPIKLFNWRIPSKQTALEPRGIVPGNDSSELDGKNTHKY